VGIKRKVYGGITMKRFAAFLAAITFCAAGFAYADYSVWDKGMWPESWPKELEPLRKQSRTLEGPVQFHRMNTIFIELVVDGKIVDLNRIPLPRDTPIIDERFKNTRNK
jgi:hypothetical protein